MSRIRRVLNRLLHCFKIINVFQKFVSECRSPIGKILIHVRLQTHVDKAHCDDISRDLAYEIVLMIEILHDLLAFF
jgi:hypothetical protein